MVVNNNTDNGWTSIFDIIREFSKVVKEPTQDTKSYISTIKN